MSLYFNPNSTYCHSTVHIARVSDSLKLKVLLQIESRVSEFIFLTFISEDEGPDYIHGMYQKLLFRQVRDMGHEGRS